MRILLFAPWSIHEGISKGTVIPLIACMARYRDIERIVLCTPEGRDFSRTDDLPDKCLHLPLTLRGASLFDKFLDLVRFPFILTRIIRSHSIDVLWCKGAPAGGIGSVVSLLSSTPFVVDSFEPHSDYMAGSQTWSRQNPKFLMQRFLEQLTKRRARILLPVSTKYYEQVLGEGIERDRMFVLPCVVDLKQFAFRADSRTDIRKRLAINQDWIVGVYVGKYGGLYYDEEAFLLYRALFDHFGERFFLMLITEMGRDTIFSKLSKHGIPVERVMVSKIEHSRVPDYLSAADFGISTIKNFPSMRFCSPVKHGEYWAADLPVLSTLKCGDDAEIITKEGGGALIDASGLYKENFSKLQDLLGRGRTGFCAGLAFKYRNLRIMERAIQFVLNTAVTKRMQDD